MAEKSTERPSDKLDEANSRDDILADFANDGAFEPAGRANGEVPIFDFAEFGAPDGGTADPAGHGNTGSASGDGTSASEPAGKRGRGRPRGSRNSTRTAQAVHLGGFEDLLFAVHLGMAQISHCPELELDESEAKKLTIALDKLAQHYHVAPTETQKVWMNFLGATGSIYGTRLYAIYKRTSKEKAKQKEPATIHTLYPGEPAE